MDETDSQDIQQSFDPFDTSDDRLLSITFSKSNSPVYPLAVSVAQGAKWYQEMNIGGKVVHFAALEKSKKGATRAQALIDYVKSWKGVQMYVAGRLLTQQNMTFEQVLGCFLNACACNDWTAHCQTIIDDPALFPIPRYGPMRYALSGGNRPGPPKKAVIRDTYAFPCRLLRERFEYEKGHPASIEDQIQAAAVEYGCDWCPNFDPGNFKKAGTRAYHEDFFESRV